MPYNVYVIELDRQVLESGKFRKANPDRREDKPCVYVGSTVHSPKERMEQHRRGYKSNRFVHRFGIRLRPRLFKNYQGIQSRKEVERVEAFLAKRLRKRGYAVWFG
jgi:hypothetical protein